MRKRLGAIHSDTIEEFEKLAVETNNKSLIFYNYPSFKQKTSHMVNQKLISSFDYTSDLLESSMDTCDSASNLSDITFRLNNVMIIDSRLIQARPHVFQFCSIEASTSDQNYSLDFATKVGLQEKTFRFWIYNIQNSQFQQIIDGNQCYSKLFQEYIRCSETFIFFYHSALKLEYSRFLQKIKELKDQDIITIYKIKIDPNQLVLAYKSFKTVSDTLHIQKILCQSIKDALELLQ